MTIRLGENDGQRDAVGIGEHMVLASQFAPIRGIWAGFFASTGSAHRSAVHKRPKPINLVACLEFGKENLKNALPNPGFLPLPKAAQASVSGGKITGGGKRPPRNTRLEDE